MVPTTGATLQLMSALLGTTSTEKAICVGCEAPICVGLWCDAKALDANDSETICVVCGNDADQLAICVARCIRCDANS